MSGIARADLPAVPSAVPVLAIRWIWRSSPHPAVGLLDVVRDCGKADIRNAVIVSQGLATATERQAGLLQEGGDTGAS